MKSTTSLVNHNSQSLITKTFDGHHTKLSPPPVFVLCDRCYWCATYFNNTRIPPDNNCPQCNANAKDNKYSMLQLQQQEKGNLHGQKSKKEILLVDDEPDSCFVYEVVLQEAGYECISYNDSVKALQEFRPNYYDLVILDIMMPELDGFAFCEKLREVDNAVPIIFITATEGYYESFRRQYYIELSKEVNIKAIQKPIGNDELVNIVNNTIATRDKN
jgi:CheY-like chemotaxis protein